MDTGNNMAHTFVGVPWVFSSLKHKCAKTEFISLLAALKYFLLGEAVTMNICSASANATVEAVVFAMVGNLYEATDEDFVAIDVPGQLVRLVEKVADTFLVVG